MNTAVQASKDKSGKPDHTKQLECCMVRKEVCLILGLNLGR